MRTGRGPDKKPRKPRPSRGLLSTSIRLTPEVIEFFQGSTTTMRAVLERYVRYAKAKEAKDTKPFDNV